MPSQSDRQSSTARRVPALVTCAIVAVAGLLFSGCGSGGLHPAVAAEKLRISALVSAMEQEQGLQQSPEDAAIMQVGATRTPLPPSSLAPLNEKKLAVNVYGGELALIAEGVYGDFHSVYGVNVANGRVDMVLSWEARTQAMREGKALPPLVEMAVQTAHAMMERWQILEKQGAPQHQLVEAEIVGKGVVHLFMDFQPPTMSYVPVAAIPVRSQVMGEHVAVAGGQQRVA